MSIDVSTVSVILVGMWQSAEHSVAVWPLVAHIALHGQAGINCAQAKVAKLKEFDQI